MRNTTAQAHGTNAHGRSSALKSSANIHSLKRILENMLTKSPLPLYRKGLFHRNGEWYYIPLCPFLKEKIKLKCISYQRELLIYSWEMIIVALANLLLAFYPF